MMKRNLERLVHKSLTRYYGGHCHRSAGPARAPYSQKQLRSMVVGGLGQRTEWFQRMNRVLKKPTMFLPVNRWGLHQGKSVDSKVGGKLARTQCAQLLIVDPENKEILLGTHTDKGVFPGRMTGLCVDWAIVRRTEQEEQQEQQEEEPTSDQSVPVAAPEIVMAAAIYRHGIELDPSEMERRAVLEFIEWDAKAKTVIREEIIEDWILYAEINKHDVSLRDTDTWRPEWCSLEAIPYHKMPVDDAVWYPPFLEGKKLFGRFVFDDKMLITSMLEPITDKETEWDLIHGRLAHWGTPHGIERHTDTRHRAA